MVLYSHFRLLDAMLQLQKIYPGNEMVLTIFISLINNLQSVLPIDPPPTVKMLHSAILSASNVPAKESTISTLSLQFIHTLWAIYKEKLSASCDLDGLAQILNKALDAESSQTRAFAFIVAGDTLQNLLSYLNDQQLKALSEKGVYRCLRTLLKYCNEVEFITLRKVVLNVATFSSVSPCTEEILAEGFAGTIVSCANAVWTDDSMQSCMYEILSAYWENRQFCEEILKQNFLFIVTTCFHHDCCHQPLFALLSTIYATIPDILSKSCLEEEDFMLTILDIIHPDSLSSVEDIEDACILLHNISLCTVDSPELSKYDVVTRMEDCATKWPLVCSLWACKTIEIIAGSLIAYEDQGNKLHMKPPRETSVVDKVIAVRFFNEAHYLFLMDMLADTDLCSKPDLLSAMYMALETVILGSPDEDIAEMYSPNFIKLFTFNFIRDTTSFPQLSASIIECACVFMDRVSWKEEIYTIQQANFHVAVVNLLRVATTIEMCNRASDLLRCLAELYHEYLADLTPLMKCQATKVVLHALKAFGCKDGEDSAYGTNLASILILMAENKAIGAEMYAAGQVDNLLELVQGECSPSVYSMLLFTIGSVASQEYVRQQNLVDCKFHLTLLQRIKSIASSTPIDFQCLCNCFETMGIVACNDLAKNELVKHGCITLVLDTLDRETGIVFDTGLDLLGTLSSAPVLQKQPDTMSCLLKMVATILQGGREMTATLIEALNTITMCCQEQDSMLKLINELGITKLLLETLRMKHINFSVRQCTSMVVERQFLYMISIVHAAQDGTDRFTSTTAETETQIFNSIQNLTLNIPKARELDDTSRLKLVSLGIDPSEPILRIGRVYGVDVGDCYGCQIDNWAENIVIHPHGLTCHQYQRLIDKGWSRRGGVRLYHSSCCHNVECTDWETRIDVHNFDYCSHKCYVKVLKKVPVGRLTVETHPTHFSQEAFELYNKYNLERHGWPPICEEEYCKHVVDSPISKEYISGIEHGSFHQLYRLDGKLVAVGLIDIVPKGIVSLYMWYSLDKEVSKYSLGVYSALKEIEMVRELSKTNPEMKYYYLQGWVEGNKKFAYKVRYSPEEFYCACITSEWVPSLDAVKEAKGKYLKDHTHDQYNHPLCIGPKTVSDQVVCAAYENDRVKYEQLTGRKPDVSKMVVCLNGTTYLHLGNMFSSFGVDKHQQDVLEKRFEEILVSMDPDLAQNIVVDLKTHVIALPSNV